MIDFSREDYRIYVKLNEELKRKIENTAHEISKKNYPYDALCWALAEYQLIFEKGNKKYYETEVIECEKKIFNSSLDYKEICWLIAYLKVYLEEIKLFP